MRFIIKTGLAVILSLTSYGALAAQTRPAPLGAVVNDYPDYSQVSAAELNRRHQTGDAHASYTLGYNYFFNQDGELRQNIGDVQAGLRFLDAAHKRGHDFAHTALHTVYTAGVVGGQPDIERANHYSLDAAQRGDVFGKVNYGLYNLYARDAAVSKRAHDFLIDVSGDDIVGGEALLGLTELYYFGREDFKPDYVQGRRFAEKCVAFGESLGDCDFILARDYSEGWGGPKDEARSAALFLQGAEAGNARAMWYAGMNALNGNVVLQNENEAFKWVSRGAELDDGNALISLGVMYAVGQGTPVSYQNAYGAYQKAARLGSAHAVRSMAAMHCEGQGRAKNAALCKAGLFLAAEHGDDQARLLLNSIFKPSEAEVATMRRAPSAMQKVWTDQFPWLLENLPR